MRSLLKISKLLCAGVGGTAALLAFLQLLFPATPHDFAMRTLLAMLGFCVASTVIPWLINIACRVFRRADVVDLDQRCFLGVLGGVAMLRGHVQAATFPAAYVDPQSGWLSIIMYLVGLAGLIGAVALCKRILPTEPIEVRGE